MTKIALTSVLVKLYVFKMAKVAGSFGHLEFLFIGFVLVAGGAVDLLAFDLFLFIQVWFVNKNDLFGKFNFFGLELIIGLAVTGGGHAAGIGYSWPC